MSKFNKNKGKGEGYKDLQKKKEKHIVSAVVAYILI